MPNLKIIYVVGYGLKKNTGRNKATREKASALREIAGEKNFRLFYPSSSGNKMAGYFYMLIFDLKMLGTLLFVKRGTVIIERQTFLLLTNIYLYLRKISIIYELHADLCNEIRLLDKNRIEKSLLYILAWFEKFNLKIASGIIYNHPLLETTLRGKYPKPSICSYNGSNTLEFIIKDQASCRKKLHLDPSAKYFLFLGMISGWHGVDLLIEIFRKDEIKDYVLLLVGSVDNKYVGRLKRAATGYPNIIFINHTDIRTAVDYINASNICLLPVNQIRSSPGSPLKLYDYIACGKPVVTQEKVLGYSDEVERYNLGIVTDFRDPVVSSKCLMQFDREADLNFYRKNNRNIAVREVSWQVRMKHVLSWIEERGFAKQ